MSKSKTKKKYSPVQVYIGRILCAGYRRKWWVFW